MDVRRLLTLAASALEDPSIESIEKYLLAFNQAERDLGIRGTERQLKELSQSHAQVIAEAERLKAEVGAALKSLRTKGKGIKAYIDPMPARVSTRRPRKG